MQGLMRICIRPHVLKDSTFGGVFLYVPEEGD